MSIALRLPQGAAMRSRVCVYRLQGAGKDPRSGRPGAAGDEDDQYWRPGGSEYMRPIQPVRAAAAVQVAGRHHAPSCPRRGSVTSWATQCRRRWPRLCRVLREAGSFLKPCWMETEMSVCCETSVMTNSKKTNSSPTRHRHHHHLRLLCLLCPSSLGETPPAP